MLLNMPECFLLQVLVKNMLRYKCINTRFRLAHSFKVCILYIHVYQADSSMNAQKVVFFYKYFDQMWLSEETRIAQVLILTSFPGPTALHSLRRTDERCGDKRLLIFEGRAEYTHRREKKPDPSGA